MHQTIESEGDAHLDQDVHHKATAEQETIEDDDEDDDVLLRRLAQLSTESSSERQDAHIPPDLTNNTCLKTLFASILDSTQPIMSQSLIEVLLQDAACQLFCSFVTMSSTGQSSSDEDCKQGTQRGGTLTEVDEAAWSRSWNATLLLISNEQVRIVLERKASVIIESMFRVFQPEASGCYHQAARVIDHVLRCCTEQALHVVGRSKGAVKHYFGRMIANLTESPVADLLIKLICIPPADNQGNYVAMPATKWRLFESLAEWRVLMILAEEVFGETRAEQVSAAADVLVELIERLPVDDNGELILQPVGHCTDFVDNLFARAIDTGGMSSQRVDCARCLTAAALRSGSKFVPPPGHPVGGSQAAQAMVANQFRSVHKHFHHRLALHLPELCECLGTGPTAQAPDPTSSTRAHHPGYTVPSPFSYLRLLLVTLLVCLVDAEDKHVSQIPKSLWSTLCALFFDYPFSNLYHGLFYRLVYHSLKTTHNSEQIQQTLFSRCKLLVSLIESYSKGDLSAGNRGHILLLLNAVRLRADTQPPSGWLRSFLKSHEIWRKFLPTLREVTEKAFLNYGLGKPVPAPDRAPALSDHFGEIDAQREGLMNPFLERRIGVAKLQREQKGHGPAPESKSIDHGSALAKLLGFGDDEPYVEDPHHIKASKRRKRPKVKGKVRHEKDSGGESNASDIEAVQGKADEDSMT